MVELILCSLIIHKCVIFNLYGTLDDCIDKAKLLIEDMPVAAFCFDKEVVEVKMRKTGTK